MTTQSLYDQLSAMTVVVADTGDIKSIEKFKPRDATTNPSLITAAAQMPAYAPIVDEVIARTKKDAGAKDAGALLQATIEALDALLASAREESFTGPADARAPAVVAWRAYRGRDELAA